MKVLCYFSDEPVEQISFIENVSIWGKNTKIE